MTSKRKSYIKAVATIIVSSTVLLLGPQKVDADTTAKVSQGVILKTSQLKVNKVIVAPSSNPNEGESASVSTNNLSRGANNLSGQVTSYAYNFIGTPYVYGANGPSSFDCSGFTKYVYSYMGINLPRTSQSQYYSGSKVSMENLETGDLVFFNTDTNLGHVGIYIGGGDFIHASSSKGVTVSSLNEGYYSSRYAGAVRY